MYVPSMHHRDETGVPIGHKGACTVRFAVISFFIWKWGACNKQSWRRKTRSSTPPLFSSYNVGLVGVRTHRLQQFNQSR